MQNEVVADWGVRKEEDEMRINEANGKWAVGKEGLVRCEVRGNEETRMKASVQ